MGIYFILIVILVECYSEYIPPGPKYKCPEKPEIIHPCKCFDQTDNGLFIRCEYSNLANLAIALHNLATLDRPIEELTLFNSHISHFHGSLFYKSKCKILKIEDTPVEHLDDNLFFGINDTLQELYILNSSLTEFPAAALNILGNLQILMIDNHQITTIDKIAFSNSLATGKLEKLRLVNGNISNIPIEAFQSLRKLKLLDLHGNNLDTLKKNQFKNLRDVEILDISRNKIKKLESHHIADLTKLTWCNVSHNELTELTRGTFARNSVLKVLRMDHNYIKRLDSNSFRGMRFLRHLYFNDNNITDIGRGTFGSITRIGVINLARNFINKIDYQMFSQLNFAEFIDISENKVTEIQKQSFKDLYLTVINISHNAISKIEGNSFENCANMTVLDLSHNLIEEIPKNAFDETTYAYDLQLSYNFLTNLSQIPLHNMTGLRILNVSHNLIADIPRNTFPKLYELHTIDFAYNKINSISNAVFQTLFSLRTLDFSYNSLESIKPPTFGTLPTLLSMDLSHNSLQDIARSAFVKLTSLRFLTLNDNVLEKLFQIPISLNYLNLKNNRITEIVDQTWPSMNALLNLDLDGNQIGDNLGSGSFSGLLTVQMINLNSNGITRIPKEALSTLATLRYLHLENNNITNLPRGAFGRLPVVFEVHLYNNQIHNISQHAFEGLLQLIDLNLSSNAIKTIPNEAFSGLVSLQTLDLSNNLIEKIDNKTNSLLDDCYSLEKINLNRNRISFLTKKSFPSNPYIPYKLMEIDLSYNLMPVLTKDITIGTSKVKRLNISHNSINIIRSGVLGNLTSLETLDLSYNGFEELGNYENKIAFPENITNLYLNDNKLVRLPSNAIDLANNLTILNIRNNELQTFDWKIMNKLTKIDFYLSGNPIFCDCNIRPLNHFLKKYVNLPEKFRDIKCTNPKYLKNKRLFEVSDNYLNCIDYNKTLNNEEYDILPDVRFREIFYSKNSLFASWFVTAVNEDIGDFYLNIRNNENIVLLEYYLPYDTRNVKIPGDKLQNENMEQLQICILAKDSANNLRTSFDSQCYALPKNFENIKRQYNDNYAGAYSIFSSRKPKNLQHITKSTGSINMFHMSTWIIIAIHFLYQIL